MDTDAMQFMNPEQRQAYLADLAKRRHDAHEAECAEMDKKFGITIPRSEAVEKIKRIMDRTRALELERMTRFPTDAR